MMPDLGTYAGPVLWSYAVSLTLVAVIVALSIAKSRRARKALDEVERRSEGNG